MRLHQKLQKKHHFTIFLLVWFCGSVTVCLAAAPVAPYVVGLGSVCFRLGGVLSLAPSAGSWTGVLQNQHTTPLSSTTC